ncbi:hypothetical protein ACEN32_06530 [Marinilactibacillus psychrotolerans]|uniref:SF0329 family protein n=1 Tax=Marinilactibacillus psychrotolerans TaxID=191770 RepID=UPI003887C2E9
MRYKKWSQTKKLLMSFLCDDLRSRVDYQLVNYRKAHDQTGRAYITVDKKEVLNMCSLISMNKEAEEEQRIINERVLIYDLSGTKSILETKELAVTINMNKGIYAQWDFLDIVNMFLHNPIEVSLGSQDLLTNILCLLDRRVGKRTLRRMNESIQDHHELIQYFYQLRCEAEKV